MSFLLYALIVCRTYIHFPQAEQRRGESHLMFPYLLRILACGTISEELVLLVLMLRCCVRAALLACRAHCRAVFYLLLVVVVIAVLLLSSTHVVSAVCSTCS